VQYILFVEAPFHQNHNLPRDTDVIARDRNDPFYENQAASSGDKKSNNCLVREDGRKNVVAKILSPGSSVPSIDPPELRTSEQRRMERCLAAATTIQGNALLWLRPRRQERPADRNKIPSSKEMKAEKNI